MKVSLPEFIRCWGMMKLGREYLLSKQELDIYGTASAYKGPVLLLHGSEAVAFFVSLRANAYCSQCQSWLPLLKKRRYAYTRTDS